MEPTTIFAFLERFGLVEGSLILLAIYALRERQRRQRGRLATSERQRFVLQRELDATRRALWQAQQQITHRDQTDTRKHRKRFWRW